MEKTPQRVSKESKRQEQGKKITRNKQEEVKDNILRDNQPSTLFSTDNSTPSTPSYTYNSTPSTSSSTINVTTKSSVTYIYGVDIVTVLAIGACAFFAYNKKSLSLSSQ